MTERAELTEKLYTAEEVAEMLRLSVNSVYKYMRTGTLEHYRFGASALRVSKAQLAKFKKARTRVAQVGQ